MYSKISPRKAAYKAALADFILEQYGVACTLSEAERGFYGETWIAQSAAMRYFVKLDYSRWHRQIYTDSLGVLEYMTRSGITFAGGALRAAGGALHTEFSGGALAVFRYIEGVHTEDYPLSRLFGKLSLVYALALPEAGSVPLARDILTARAYDEFALRLASFQADTGTPEKSALAGKFREKSGLIAHRAQRLRLFAERIKKAPPEKLVITNGDAGGNVIIGDDFSIIDWDEVRLAPPERDAWFFVQREGQTEEIERTLGFRLRPDIMAFYCYSMFFDYLNYYLRSYEEFPGDDKNRLAEEMAGYFDCWIENCMPWADGV